MDNIVDLIEKQPFFSGFSSHNLELLSDCASIQIFPENKYIFKTDEHAGKFFFIDSGVVSLEIGITQDEIVQIQKLGKGDILGWSWQFEPYQWHFDARTLEETRLIVFDTKCFFETFSINLLLAYELQKRFSKIMFERLQAAREQILKLKSTKI